MHKYTYKTLIYLHIYTHKYIHTYFIHKEICIVLLSFCLSTRIIHSLTYTHTYIHIYIHTYTLVEAYEELPPDSSSSMNASLLRSLKNLLPVGNAFHLDQNISSNGEQDDLEGQSGALRRFSFGRSIRHRRVYMYVCMYVCITMIPTFLLWR